MKYLLDTNIVVAYFKDEQEIAKKIKTLKQLHISIISIGELLVGVNSSINKTKNLIILKNLYLIMRKYIILL